MTTKQLAREAITVPGYGSYALLHAQAHAETRAFHSWMRAAGFCASWRAAIAGEAGDADTSAREDATRAALVPYPWEGIAKAFSLT